MVKRILNRDVLRYTQSARILQIKLLTNHSPLPVGLKLTIETLEQNVKYVQS